MYAKMSLSYVVPSWVFFVWAFSVLIEEQLRKVMIFDIKLHACRTEWKQFKHQC